MVPGLFPGLAAKQSRKAAEYKISEEVARVLAMES